MDIRYARKSNKTHISNYYADSQRRRTDKINGLTLGADDYMQKPFRPLELVARVKSQLRRYKKYNPAQAEAEAGDVMTHAGLEMNVKAHQCLLDGKSLTLTPTEFSILQIPFRKQGNGCQRRGAFFTGFGRMNITVKRTTQSRPTFAI